jgi:hypothetical protein
MEGIIKEWKNLPKDQRSYSMNMQKETIEELIWIEIIVCEFYFSILFYFEWKN